MRAFFSQGGRVVCWLFILLSLAGCTDVNEGKAIYPDKARGELLLLDSCPAHGDENISTEAVIKLLFNKPLDPQSINSASLLLGSGRNHVKGTLFYEDDIITYVPLAPLEPNYRYDFYITASLRDTDGFAYIQNVEAFSFFTHEKAETGETCR